MLLGTAVYNGTIGVPGLTSDDLLATDDLRSSPALARSPLLARNPSPPFGAGDRASPYATRFELGPMERGNLAEATERFAVRVDK